MLKIAYSKPNKRFVAKPVKEEKHYEFVNYINCNALILARSIDNQSIIYILILNTINNKLTTAITLKVTKTIVKKELQNIHNLI